MMLDNAFSGCMYNIETTARGDYNNVIFLREFRKDGGLQSFSTWLQGSGLSYEIVEKSEMAQYRNCDVEVLCKSTDVKIIENTLQKGKALYWFDCELLTIVKAKQIGNAENEITFAMSIDLDSIIDAHGIDGLNKYVDDEICDIRMAVLQDLHYKPIDTIPEENKVILKVECFYDNADVIDKDEE